MDALQNSWRNNGWATLDYASTEQVHSGATAIKVTDPAGTAQALYLHHAAFAPVIYQSLAFWYYPTASGTNQVKVQATLRGVAQTAMRLSFSTDQKNQWQWIEIPLSSLGVAGNTDFDGFWIQNTSGGPLTFYVDDISLKEIPPPSTVAVTVDAGDVTATIDERIFGLNLRVGDQFLAGSSTTDLLTTLDTRVVRFPGGSGSDDYDWQRNRSLSNGGAFLWVNNAATFARVTETRGVQAYVTTNYGSGTPEQAAAWVAYYNAATTNTLPLGTDSKGRDWKTAGYWAGMRASTPLATDDGFNFLRVSHPAPYGFRYWEVGNECYGGWEYDQHGVSGSGLAGVAHDAYTYAQAFKNFHDKMLAVDPSIRIGAVVTESPDNYGNGTHAVANPNESNATHSGWTPVVLATLQSLGVTPHFVVYHFYAENPGEENDAMLLQSAARLETDSASIRKMLVDYCGAPAAASVELALTELNSVSSNCGKQTTSLVNALYLADAFGRLSAANFSSCMWWVLRNGALTNANNSSALYGWRQFGDYGLVASGDIPGVPADTIFPSFYATKLLRAWGRGGDRVVRATSDYPQLACYAAKLAKGSLALLVINKHPASDLSAKITLQGFTPGLAPAKIYWYGKPQDIAETNLTSDSMSVTGSDLVHTFPSYSITVIVIPGRFESWRQTHFTTAELEDWSCSGDAGEPASDGIPNLVKYALGLEPKAPAMAGLQSTGTVSLDGKTWQTFAFTLPRQLDDITCMAPGIFTAYNQLKPLKRIITVPDKGHHELSSPTPERLEHFK